MPPVDIPPSPAPADIIAAAPAPAEDGKEQEAPHASDQQPNPLHAAVTNPGSTVAGGSFGAPLLHPWDRPEAIEAITPLTASISALMLDLACKRGGRSSPELSDFVAADMPKQSARAALALFPSMGDADPRWGVIAGFGLGMMQLYQRQPRLAPPPPPAAKAATAGAASVSHATVPSGGAQQPGGAEQPQPVAPPRQSAPTAPPTTTRVVVSPEAWAGD